MQYIKKFIPPSLKKKFKLLKLKVENKVISSLMQKRHKKLITKIQRKTKIKVVFFVTKISLWKADKVFEKMLSDPYFEPLILVCPYISNDQEAMFHNMAITYDYFIQKDFPVIISYDENTNQWLKLVELSPDIVFFNSPHKATIKEYYKSAYLKYLSCYIPYHHEIDHEIQQYSQPFHNAMWRIFSTHETSKNLYQELSNLNNQNIITTGYPLLEDINTIPTIKKLKEDKRKIIIYAPHHEIWDTRPYSTFTTYASFIKDLSIKYKKEAIFIFKPHPMLKEKLYRHNKWGKDKTDEYYHFWEQQENTAIFLEDYLSLFKSSDALIHDCGSFILEYLYFNKPALYLYSKDNTLSQYNSLGKLALDSICKAYNKSDIQNFLLKVINDDTTAEIDKILFFNKENIIKNKNKPSSIIISEIKKNLKL